jgi:hypothetical protein
MTDAATFRADFPEFADTTAYPDTQVNFWIGIASKLVSLDRWADLTDFGIELLVAHNLVLWKQSAIAVAAGAIPGQSSGVVSAKAVADVSKSYDTTVASVEGGGNYNLTTYGTRYLEFVSIFGAGGYQL